MGAMAVKNYCKKLLMKFVDICYAGRYVEKCRFMLENEDLFVLIFYVGL